MTKTYAVTVETRGGAWVRFTLQARSCNGALKRAQGACASDGIEWRSIEVERIDETGRLPR